ncbi:NnrS family protein [Rugamonas apoptosis]|uniref:NnrS family protein n=1 Tax=Rugamonas apoptosis TaxID=2758570 RepID=A0A7W2IK62_9BURK|nr:NnrS family protein [Rugamonas apoptosis]MBA5687420.1 NnrS family protein [Rugamonas apoptosis]
MSLLHIDEPLPASTPAPWQMAHPLWRLGFRPFYLLAALFAALSIPLWIAQYYGWLHAAHIDAGWHMHEMAFGMVTAVVIGFLFTAARNWTGLWTPVRGHLAALVALWLAGRLAMLWAPAPVAAAVDWLFLPLATWPLGRVMAQSNNKRNYFLVGLLALLAVANGLYHLSTLGLLAMAQAVPVRAAILVIVVMESAIATRVLPMFTRNGAPGTDPVVRPMRDRVSLGLLAATALAWVAGAPGWLTAPLALAAGALVLVRLAGWQPHKVWHVPLLWVLHLSYAWIGVGCFLLAGAALGWLPTSAAFHALTVGSMTGLIIGMITRTTLGHTGRPLKVGRAEFAMFALIQAGALARVAAALATDGLRDGALLLSAACWTVAFVAYVIVYLPYLSRARIDGNAG